MQRLRVVDLAKRLESHNTAWYRLDSLLDQIEGADRIQF